MNLDEFMAAAKPRATKKTVTWKQDDGTEMSMNVGIRALSFAEVESLNIKDGEAENETETVCKLLVAAVEFEDGRHLTMEQVRELDSRVVGALVTAANEVHNGPKA